MPNQSELKTINELLSSMSLSERLAWIAENSEKPVYTTSLAREGQFIIWNLATKNIPIEIITLQTGRLFPETLSLLNITQERYGIKIRQVEPDTEAVDGFIREHGRDGFYNSLEARKACCSVRKNNPLNSELAEADAWITGLNREHSIGREKTPLAEWSSAHNLMKFNPLADISLKEINEAIVAHEIPINPLHDRGYTSIGCEPCTRATKPGEHPRAGRWWWEQGDSSECGIHTEKTAA